MDAFLNWILPMHCNWFILWCILSALVMVVAWVWSQNNNYTTTYVNSMPNHQYHGFRAFVKTCIAVFCTAICLAVFGWLFYSASRNPEVEAEEKLEIKPVTYPDGKVVQMFNCNGVNYNCNSMYSCSPPPGSYVRRVVFKKVYAGVLWPVDRPNGTNANATNKDAFFLVTPNGEDKKAENLVPGQ